VPVATSEAKPVIVVRNGVKKKKDRWRIPAKPTTNDRGNSSGAIAMLCEKKKGPYSKAGGGKLAETFG